MSGIRSRTVVRGLTTALLIAGALSAHAGAEAPVAAAPGSALSAPLELSQAAAHAALPHDGVPSAASPASPAGAAGDDTLPEPGPLHLLALLVAGLLGAYRRQWP